VSPAAKAKITRVDAWPVKMRLAEPYTIAYESVEEAVNVFLRLETDAGVVGCGCAGPDREVCGESAGDVVDAVREVIDPALRGSDALRLEPLLREMTAALAGRPAALAMADMALRDIEGRVRGTPLFRVLGGEAGSMVTSVTIGILPEDETVACARRWLERGFSCLKLKGGLDRESDAARVLKVREVVGEDVELRFDANGGYSVEGALAFAEEVRPARLEFVEQPTPRDRPELLAEVAAKLDLAVMADEALVTPADARAIAASRGADMLNVKLMKVGGIARALEVDEVASAAGMPVMVGCMDEAALAIAAGLHLALARPNIRYADLDGHLDLEGDPSAGAVILEDGRLRPTGRPGLGFDVDRE
jgi:L-alanine-DL-glutamate epimerase-like enolase superfamily enzyme